MSFKAFVSSAAIAGTLVTSVLVASAPVEAATIAIGSTINFSSTPRGVVKFDKVSGLLDFGRVVNGNFQPGFQFAESGGGSGDFSSVGLFPVVKDITLAANPGGIYSLTSQVDDFISWINLPPLFPRSNDVQFTLQSFIFNSNNGETTSLTGFFTRDGVQTKAIGNFTTQTSSFAHPSWSLSLETVPTPALLPGLIGMGIAALRRKDNEESEENA